MREGVKWYRVSRARSHVWVGSLVVVLLVVAFVSSGFHVVGSAALAAKIWAFGVVVVEGDEDEEEFFNNLSLAKSAWDCAMVTPTYESKRGLLP